MGDSIGKVELAAALGAEGAAGEAAGVALGERLYRHAATEFDIPGIHLGVFYSGSPVVVSDGTSAPADDSHRYTPNAVPGAHAPHVWPWHGVSRFGQLTSELQPLRHHF